MKSDLDQTSQSICIIAGMGGGMGKNRWQGKVVEIKTSG
jgi:hypothetical protein